MTLKSNVNDLSARIATEFNTVRDEIDLKLALSGGTLTGALVLASAPTQNMHAATKKYVDDAVASAGGGSTPYFAYSTNYTATSSDSFIPVYCNGVSPRTITLPLVPKNGQIITVKKMTSFWEVIVAGNGKTIDGSSSVTIPSGSNGSLTLQYLQDNGYPGWYIIAKY